MIVLVLLVLTGLRQWFLRPTTATSTTSSTALPAGTRFPTAAAAGVATRFAAAYLTWDATKPDARRNALLSAGWAGDPEAGWNRRGRQAVSGPVTVLRVDARTDTEGTVTVAAQVVPWVTKGKQLVRGTARNVGLRIPVMVTGTGEVFVASLPAMIAPPAAIPPAGLTLNEVDDVLSRETRNSIADFFTSYGRESDLSAIAAPGAQIRGLKGGLTFVSVTNWTVAPPAGHDETAAIARVLWQSPDGAQLEQTYALTLRLTTSGKVARWQVFTIL